MRTVLSLLAIGLCALSFSGRTVAEGFADHGTVTAKRAGGKVTIRVAGKGEWNVNTEYDTKVTHGSTVLRKKDAKFEGQKDGGKAAAAVFESSDAANDGEVKAVFCDKSSCTSPLKTKFTVK
jgi:hypothetical protein